jgi:XTP/dITP diphosphohydrolase
MQYPLIIASSNQGKIKEFAQLLQKSPFDILSAKSIGGMPAVNETGSSFLENAIIKAQAVHAKAPEGHWVLADDSGLSVEALNGAPGVYSARYAGEHASDTDNCAKLLAALAKDSTANRRAQFECALCLIDDYGRLSYYTGVCAGQIATEAQGTHGFGYDPLFIPDGYTTTFGVLDKQIKAKISHRAQACEHFVASFTDF